MAVHLGTPGVAELTKLMTISARIGVADSARYLKKNRKMVGSLLTPGKFGPDALLLGMADAFCDPDGARRGAPPVHVQPGGGHARVAAADARRAGVAFGAS